MWAKTPATGLMFIVAGVMIVAGCSSGSSSSEATDTTTSSVVTTTSVVPGAELQGAWSVDFALDQSAANDPGDATQMLDTFHETWVFSESADGCEPGAAGCLVNTRDDGASGDAKAVDVDGDGYKTDKTVQEDTLCDGSATGSVHSIRTFTVDASGQMTGVYHQVITPDDPSTCAPIDGTWTLTAVRADNSTATTAP